MTINIKVVVNVNKGGRGSCSFVLKFVAKSLPPVVCRALMSWLRCLCLLAYSGLQHIFVLWFFLRLVCPVLAVSLDCPFLVALSMFSNVYLLDY